MNSRPLDGAAGDSACHHWSRADSQGVLDQKRQRYKHCKPQRDNDLDRKPYGEVEQYPTIFNGCKIAHVLEIDPTRDHGKPDKIQKNKYNDGYGGDFEKGG